MTKLKSRSPSIEPRRVLVLAPHPDDESIGCGGAIQIHLKQGDQVTVVYVTTGAASTPTHSYSEFVKLRKPEVIASAAALGLSRKDLLFLNLPPCHINQTKLNHLLLNVIRQARPSVIYLPHELEGHIDHRAVYEAGMFAAQFGRSRWFRKKGEETEADWKSPSILGYEVWTPLSKPHLVVDISSVLKGKQAAILAHKSQDANEYLNAATARGTVHALMVEGKRHSANAEAFTIYQLQAECLF